MIFMEKLTKKQFKEGNKHASFASRNYCRTKGKAKN